MVSLHYTFPKCHLSNANIADGGRGEVIQMLTLSDKWWWGFIQLLTFADRGEVGVKYGLKYADVILAWSFVTRGAESFIS